jgi:hypothetical protein
VEPPALGHGAGEPAARPYYKVNQPAPHAPFFFENRADGLLGTMPEPRVCYRIRLIADIG